MQALGSSGRKKKPARERETGEGEVPSPLTCLPLGRPFFFCAYYCSKRRVLRILGRDKAGHQ